MICWKALVNLLVGWWVGRSRLYTGCSREGAVVPDRSCRVTLPSVGYWCLDNIHTPSTHSTPCNYTHPPHTQLPATTHILYTLNSLQLHTPPHTQPPATTHTSTHSTPCNWICTVKCSIPQCQYQITLTILNSYMLSLTVVVATIHECSVQQHISHVKIVRNQGSEN